MNRSRLDRIGRDLMALAPSPRCPTCDGPLDGHDPTILVDVAGRPLRPTCPACGLLIDDQGRAKLRDARWAGRVRRVIVLERGEPSPNAP